jgi:hypothetical protein
MVGVDDSNYLAFAVAPSIKNIGKGSKDLLLYFPLLEFYSS